jgi:hypothetical protein
MIRTAEDTAQWSGQDAVAGETIINVEQECLLENLNLLLVVLAVYR